MSRAKQFAELLRNRNMDSELEQFNNSLQFISSRQASHKPSNKRNCVQGKHIQEKPKNKKSKHNKTKRQITLDNLKQRLEQACFIVQGGSIEDLPNDTSANQDSGSAVATSNQTNKMQNHPFQMFQIMLQIFLLQHQVQMLLCHKSCFYKLGHLITHH